MYAATLDRIATALDLDYEELRVFAELMTTCSTTLCVAITSRHRPVSEAPMTLIS